MDLDTAGRFLCSIVRVQGVGRPILGGDAGMEEACRCNSAKRSLQFSGRRWSAAAGLPGGVEENGRVASEAHFQFELLAVELAVDVDIEFAWRGRMRIGALGKDLRRTRHFGATLSGDHATFVDREG